LLGAGGGGFLAFIMRPERRAAVSNALRGLIQVSVDIDPDGSRIMVYEPNDVDEPDDYQAFGTPSFAETR
jgi:D-glycero-alpha-D-manno-heptose-7-phosphate kinase